MTPIALTIAGSDSGGGAGIQADLKAFSALGVYGASVITAITAQNTREVRAVEEVSTPMIGAQIDAVLDDLPVTAIKIGMLSSAAIVREVATRLDGRIPVVLDPVMIAKSGDTLLRDDAIEALISELLPRIALLTPNLPEAARLLECEPARNVEEMRSQGAALLRLGAGAVLMKGGHGSGPVCTDVLIMADAAPVVLSAPRIETRNTHGTGCTLSAAIAAGLARKMPLAAAFRAAHDYLQGAIRASEQLHIGSGQGPVHHFHASPAWST
ncbi:MAG TPA: bifunctional hydroxymethylpyrimidine kinase/phosphomethylpyrimidine kinase [Paracoccaceae bacterium]|nr:bifunctional hydroxymethylpyrimidine kinase/phosphomethylpyrimidine kinase [Paracoccaceae bacterium]